MSHVPLYVPIHIYRETDLLPNLFRVALDVCLMRVIWQYYFDFITTWLHSTFSRWVSIPMIVDSDFTFKSTLISLTCHSRLCRKKLWILPWCIAAVCLEKAFLIILWPPLPSNGFCIINMIDFSFLPNLDRQNCSHRRSYVGHKWNQYCFWRVPSAADKWNWCCFHIGFCLLVNGICVAFITNLSLWANGISIAFVVILPLLTNATSIAFMIFFSWWMVAVLLS